MIKILFLAANPKDTDRLRLDEEVRAIKERLRLADLRDQFVVEQEHAVRVTDLQGFLLQHRPHIVHFSGHGSRAGAIVFGDAKGESQPVPPGALKRTFAVLRDNIRCVVLNACYTEVQAKGIAESIDCVVGMGRAIGDESAVAFAASFYQALGYGRSIQEAFDLGCGQIDLEGLGDEDVPKLTVATGVEAKDLYLTRNADSLPAKEPDESKGGAAEVRPGPTSRGSEAKPVEVFFSYSHLDGPSPPGRTSAVDLFWNVPFPRNPAFTGRKDTLADLRKRLTRRGRAALCGLGGIGKSQTAAEYAYRYRGEYVAILWLNAESPLALRKDGLWRTLPVHESSLSRGRSRPGGPGHQALVDDRYRVAVDPR
jgi:hypothetical protein